MVKDIKRSNESFISGLNKRCFKEGDTMFAMA